MVTSTGTAEPQQWVYHNLICGDHATTRLGQGRNPWSYLAPAPSSTAIGGQLKLQVHVVSMGPPGHTPHVQVMAINFGTPCDAEVATEVSPGFGERIPVIPPTNIDK